MNILVFSQSIISTLKIIGIIIKMFTSYSFLIVVSSIFSWQIFAKEYNDRPIIGIFTQPTTSIQGTCGGNCLYIAASYVKYIESSGGRFHLFHLIIIYLLIFLFRVVPINYYSSNDELDILFESLNGFLFPGGSASFPSSAQYICKNLFLTFLISVLNR